MSILKRYVSMLLILPFLLGTLVPPSIAADMPWMPQPGAAVPLSPAFMPAQLKGMVIHPNDPFMFDFIIYRGDETLAGDAKQAEYQKLIKYFLASLAVPDTDQWVNLSPYEKDRIVPDNFGLTEMGRDLLAQDYLLKQLAASLTSPDTDLGRKFWEQVYRNAREKFGTVDIPTDVISKVWVVPDKAVLYEKDGGVYVVEHHLKVMTDRDYLAMQENRLEAAGGSSEGSSSQVTSAVLREVILPAIEKEINSAKNFAPLRQVYSGMLLAAWYKRALKASILNKVYGDRSKVKGVEQDDPALNQQIWEQYVAAFRQGVFNLVREDTDRLTEEVIPRKYFAGGMLGDGAMRTVENARRLQAIPTGERIQDAEQVRVKVEPFGDAAMQARPEQEKKSYFEGLEAPEVPVFDPGDRLQRQIREIVAKAEDSPFAANDLFGEYMAAAIAAGYRDTEAGHLEALYAVFQARMSAALDRKDSFDEHSLAKSMRQSLDSRLIGSGWSVPETTVRAGAGLYPGLYEMISQGLLRGGFTLSVELAEGRTHIRMQEIGSTGMMYEQNFTQHEFDDSLILYNATSGEVQAIMKYLDNLWSVVNDLNGLLDDRIAALAEYEWWFFQANPFFRGAASIGDAMSLIAQLKMGLRLRDKFEHVDWPALSMTLPEYLEFRVA
ncbi:MAG: hypothetical protein HGA80_05905, partial [Candidatus Omnitrophica bacterium]|nr:hypothetical protein [Candidatus Omnitrophota bacterium]